MTTNPQVRDAISRQPAGTDATKTRWFGFRAIVHELLTANETAGSSNDILFHAKALLRSDYFVAGGALAGAVLERRLKDLCGKQDPPITPKGHGINAINMALKQAKIFEQPTFLKIQLIGEVRNRCVHAVPDPPNQIEISDMIKEVEKFLNDFE